jgi:hypothetical protein
MWNEIASSQTAATIGLFHIRRGDMQHECNTTIPKMKSYIDCSFAGSVPLGNITILISSDETDTEYIQTVVDLLQEGRPHVQARSLDELAWKHTREYVEKKSRRRTRLLNNFVVFSVLNIIRWKRAAFTIEQRRWFACPDCEKLVELENVTWVGRTDTATSTR